MNTWTSLSHLSCWGAAIVVHCAAAQELPQPAGKTVAVNGMQMYYEVHGSGRPLVLLHGFSMSGDWGWGKFLPAFSKQYQVIVPDLRGHGRSTNPSGEFTHRQSALDVYALLDHLKIERFSAMGISTGGMTLLHMATKQPDRVEAMVLIGATHYFPEQARQIMRTTTEDAHQKMREWWGFEHMSKYHFHGEQQIRQLRRQFHGFKDSYDDMNFTRPYLATIKARTLIVHGDRDEFFPVEIPVEMYQCIPQAALWIIPNGGHVPINDHHEAFVATAERFLAPPKRNP